MHNFHKHHDEVVIERDFQKCFVERSDQLLGLSNFAMGTILGKGFPQAQVHTVHSTSAEGTRAMNECDKCFWKTLVPMAKLHSLMISFHHGGYYIL